MKKILELYNNSLDFDKIPIKRAMTNIRVIEYEEQLPHVRWMIKQLLKSEMTSASKNNRWLGFIQGVLWANGQFTIDELKNHNKKMLENNEK